MPLKRGQKSVSMGFKRKSLSGFASMMLLPLIFCLLLRKLGRRITRSIPVPLAGLGFKIRVRNNLKSQPHVPASWLVQTLQFLVWRHCVAKILANSTITSHSGSQ